jgi:uncharacterized membrane protein
MISTLVLLSTMGMLLQNDTLVPEAAAIASFNIVVSPVSQTVDYSVNQFAWYNVLVQSVDGYIGEVTLNASITSGPSDEVSLSFPGGSVVMVPLDGQSFSYLRATIGSPLDVPTGNYTIRVRGFAGTQSSNPGMTTDANINLEVISHDPAVGDFRLSSTPGTVIDVVPGGSGALQINILSFKTTPGLYEVCLLTAASSPSEITATFDPFCVNVEGYGDNDTVLIITTTELTQAGNYTLVITGTATLNGNHQRMHTWAITVRVSGFYVVPDPAVKSVIAGNMTHIEIGVQSIGTFSSSVTLTASNVPLGMTAVFNPATVIPAQGSLATSILTIDTDPTLAHGTYILNIRGSSGFLLSDHALAITVGNFNITGTPVARTVEQGGNTTFVIEGITQSDFTAAMSLELLGAPMGVAWEFDPPKICLNPTDGCPPNSAGTSILYINVSNNAPVGTYPMWVEGTVNGEKRHFDIILTIIAPQDFLLQITPTSADVRNGSSTSFTITVYSLNDFAGDVDLSASVPVASGITGSLSPSTVPIPAGGSATSKLMITTAPTAPAGQGSISVTGTSDSISKEVTVTLTVSPTAGLPCIIATAAYGSEIAPEVYFLRFFRDTSIQTSFAGSQFMNVFNAWYYSFSPTVAEHVKNNMVFRNVVQAAIYPLLASLYVAQWSYSGLSFAPELAVVVAGLVASSLIGVVYFAPITILVVRVARRKQLRIGDINKPLMVAWISSLALIVIAEIAVLPAVMMAGTAAFVLSTIIVATKMTVTQAQRYLPK